MEKLKKEYKIVNLIDEYTGYKETCRWAVISKLSEEQLYRRYGEELQSLMPLVYLTEEQGIAFSDYKKNEEKYDKRRRRHEDTYGYEDGISEIFHQEITYDDLFEKLIAKENHRLLVRALDTLTTVQKRRLYCYFVEEKSTHEIAREEGTSHSKVVKSLNQSIKKLKKFFK